LARIVRSFEASLGKVTTALQPSYDLSCPHFTNQRPTSDAHTLFEGGRDAAPIVLRAAAGPTAISGALHVMSVPAFGMMCVGLPFALPSLARWQTLFDVLSIAFFVTAAVLLIFRLSS
jgi:hypothetical protein